MKPSNRDRKRAAAELHNANLEKQRRLDQIDKVRSRVLEVAAADLRKQYEENGHVLDVNRLELSIEDLREAFIRDENEKLGAWAISQTTTED